MDNTKFNMKMNIRSVIFENENVDIEKIKDVGNADDELLEELLTPDEEYKETVEFNEATVNALKEAYMAGFMKSNESFNGSSAKIRYRESMLKPDSVIWNENLKHGFNRFISNIKRKQEV